ncbi:hypothetical protein HALLA_17375 [Halostagnicola larsenii XH-48]|uniref:Uncharacterized protein n=2 Tax=Halostagnicola larsenii TaxID=353800 RepID=W0JR84_9EURY|nr:hypothetical protein HALLA_17375 [Halostagnicola larsenii XH-48]
MLVDGGGGVTTVHGPDPIAYQRWSERDESTEKRERTAADELERTAADE